MQPILSRLWDSVWGQVLRVGYELAAAGLTAGVLAAGLRAGDRRQGRIELRGRWLL